MILVDTSFFFPLFNQSDPDHGKVREALQDFRGQRPRDLLLTTNHIVFETVTLARSRIDHAVAVRVSQALLSETLATIHWATEGEQRDALNYLARYQDKKYSAVDCLSFLLMEKLGITEALTLDSDFSHRFTVRAGLL